MGLRGALLPPVLGVYLLLGWVNAAEAATDDFISELAQLEIEDLMTQQVTSVLRKEQTVAESPSAVYVLTQDDIRRSGHTTLPEVLRMVPGLTVSRDSSYSWSITARGFDGNGSAKLLVLIDGRTVYSPLFSGVFWDAQGVVLADIKRIEVIRGPGAVSWGENAVNGVINILTYSAAETEGVLADTILGDEDRVISAVRYGGKISPHANYRVFTKYAMRDSMKVTDGSESFDDWQTIRGGFRLDADPDRRNSFTVQGEMYDVNEQARVLLPDSFAPPVVSQRDTYSDIEGYYVLGRWNRRLAEQNNLSVQAYFDRTQRHNPEAFGETRDIADLDFQHHFRASESHDVVWGLNYRYTTDDTDSGTPLITFDPEKRTDHLVSAFIQDDYELVDDLFRVIPGIKFGYNDYTDFEYQPALKFLWTPVPNITGWASVARAVRAPARLDDDVRAVSPGPVAADGTPTAFALIGNKDFESEDLLAYEVGARTTISDDLFFDVAAFYFRYNDMISAEPLPPQVLQDVSGDSYLLQPLLLSNAVNGESYGLEVVGEWKITSWSKLVGAYWFAVLDFWADPDSLDTLSQALDRRTPQNQAHLRASFDLTEELQFDTLLYYVDSVPSRAIGSYVRTDVRLAWRPLQSWEFSVALQNLLDDKHRESSAVEIERAVYARATFKY